jgi:hypothetical protein
MATADELARLIREISRVSSPLARMKLLARAWRSLRRLQPNQRRALASQVGIDGAEDIIERLAVRRAGLSAATVQRALDAVRETDTGELKRVLHGLRDPAQRKELIAKGIDTVTGRLLGDEDEVEAEDIEAAEDTEDEQEEEESPPPLPPMEVESAAPVKPAEPPPRRAPIPPVIGPPRRPRTATPRVESRPEPSPRPAPRTRPEPPARTTALEAPKSPEPPPAVAESAAPQRATESAERTGLLGLLEHVTDARRLGAEQLRALLDLFPSDWSRRRALQALFEAHIPNSLNQAIFLIEQLESPGQRRWCASTLLHEWELGESERRAIVERHGLFRGA